VHSLVGTVIVASKEVLMAKTVDVTIPLDPEAAKALDTPARREAVGRYLSELLKGRRVREALAEAIADVKREARASGLTDKDIDAELEAWRTKRRA
jgi:Arc/MetJ family transcription regulator